MVPLSLLHWAADNGSLPTTSLGSVCVSVSGGGGELLMRLHLSIFFLASTKLRRLRLGGIGLEHDYRDVISKVLCICKIELSSETANKWCFPVLQEQISTSTYLLDKTKALILRGERCSCGFDSPAFSLQDASPTCTNLPDSLCLRRIVHIAPSLRNKQNQTREQ